MRKTFVLGKLTVSSAQIMLLEDPRPSKTSLLEAILKPARSGAPAIEDADGSLTVH